mgnify:CR=1 FL=1
MIYISSACVKNKKIKVFNFYSAKLGVSKNNSKENSLNILHDQEQLPVEDLFFNHLVGVHYIENTSNLKKTLRELIFSRSLTETSTRNVSPR